jgi:hypothetical protein
MQSRKVAPLKSPEPNASLSPCSATERFFAAFDGADSDPNHAHDFVINRFAVRR